MHFSRHITRRTLSSTFIFLTLAAMLGVSGCSKAIKTFDSFRDKSTRTSKPASASTTIGAVKVGITYGQPAKKERAIFGALVPYDKVWRTGANEATEISLSGNVTIAGKPLAAGRYTLCTIPRADKWTIIFNKTLDQWGAFFYDEKDDVLRVDVPAGSSDAVLELLTISFEPAEAATNAATNMVIAWDKTKVAVPIAAQ